MTTAFELPQWLARKHLHFHPNMTNKNPDSMNLVVKFDLLY